MDHKENEIANNQTQNIKHIQKQEKPANHPKAKHETNTGKWSNTKSNIKKARLLVLPYKYAWPKEINSFCLFRFRFLR